jgi:thiamine transport system permease protein
LSKQKVIQALDAASSRRSIKYAVYLVAIILFFALILLPPILGIVIHFTAIQVILNNPALENRALTAIANSFMIALFVAAIDLIAGIPMAWLIARKRSRWLSTLDTLSDIPFIVPTAVLGYSLLLFWNSPSGISALFTGSLISTGWLLVILLHFAFSFPVVVRVVVGALLDYKREFENASRTLGAPPFTASRTVTFPIIKPSLIAAFILAFSRSVSETGATFIVAGAFENGSIFLQNIKNTAWSFRQIRGIFGSTNPTFYGAIVFASFILIAVSVSIFLVVRTLGPRLKLPVNRIWPSFERKLSYSKAESSRNTATLAVFLAIVLIPSLFVALPAFQAIFTNTLSESLLGKGIWASYWHGLVLSYGLAAIVTVLNIIIGLPMAIAIARKKFGNVSSGILDVLVNIPLVVPSIALGFSLAIFWNTFTSIPQLLLLIFAHLTITYPYFVRSMSAAVERISIDMEEASRTLGAKPLGVFRTIILPLTKYSIFSGAVLVFTRSLSETGATMAVASTLKTVPLVLVNWIRPPPSQPAASPLQIGLGSGYLILLSFVILLASRLIVKGKGRY